MRDHDTTGEHLSKAGAVENGRNRSAEGSGLVHQIRLRDADHWIVYCDAIRKDSS